ncbi:MAG TPA: SRPBCC domain-containing protein [Actinomycetota bacterium]
MGERRRNELSVTTPGLEIVMTRVFDAPRELVFEAHSSCEHMRHWWGPRKYEVAECEIDFRPGGGWRIVLSGPDGEEHRFSGMPEPGLETYVFEERDGRTTLTASASFASAEERDEVLGSGMVEGATETYERLDGYLETLMARAAG